jgi:phosphatidate cytidylyltransferase
MIAAGVAAFVAGPFWFGLLVSLVTGLMVWELARMIGTLHSVAPVGLGIVGFALTWALSSDLLPGELIWMICLALGIGVLAVRDRVIAALYGLAVLATGTELVVLFQYQPRLVILLIAIVVVTDIAGYFAGRILGGPKFWPRVSPKKTWSGIIAGWLAAAVLGLVAEGHMMAALVAVLLSFASQMGDMAESAIKRRTGVKDSSNLIPGHGGVLDRFDGVVGASLVALAVTILAGAY